MYQGDRGDRGDEGGPGGAHPGAHPRTAEEKRSVGGKEVKQGYMSLEIFRLYNKHGESHKSVRVVPK